MSVPPTPHTTKAEKTMLNEVTSNTSILMVHNAAAEDRAPQDLLLKRIMRLRARLSFTMAAATLSADFGRLPASGPGNEE